MPASWNAWRDFFRASSSRAGLRWGCRDVAARSGVSVAAVRSGAGEVTVVAEAAVGMLRRERDKAAAAAVRASRGWRRGEWAIDMVAP